jgi:hypothetical protein
LMGIDKMDASTGIFIYVIGLTGLTL